MGWFRGRRKRRGGEPAAEAPGRAAANRIATEAAGVRQASAAARPETERSDFGEEPAAAAGAPGPVSDRIPWRHLDGGVYPRLLGPLADDGGVGALLDHCELGSQGPSGTAKSLVGQAPQAGEALGRLVGREQAAGPESAEFVGGVIRVLALLPAEEAVPLLVRLAAQESGLTAGSMPSARAAIRALAAVPGELVPPALHRLASESPLAALRKAAYAELKRRLRTLSDAPEWTVDTFGLDGDSRLRTTVGPDHVAVVRIELGGRVKIGYHESHGRASADGRALAGKPTASTVDQDAMRDVAELAAKLRTAVRAARTRLESAQKEHREIPAEDWIEHYITHPVTGTLARTLLWETRDGDADAQAAWRMGLPRQIEGRWGLVTETTERIILGDGDVLRVAAPMRLPAARARAWERLLAKAKIEPALTQIQRG
ncbi:DUF4132 domain-containing protein [Catenulispora rubra]|uniref:DUF4132 domain-containing protein n=1 Tax=Catenulispora rubra TaxID=280293 RepID=UPI00189235CE|nr:DUF4132 domain-containing protein [Catenulispora rubra]